MNNNFSKNTQENEDCYSLTRVKTDLTDHEIHKHAKALDFYKLKKLLDKNPNLVEKINPRGKNALCLAIEAQYKTHKMTHYVERQNPDSKDCIDHLMKFKNSRDCTHFNNDTCFSPAGNLHASPPNAEESTEKERIISPLMSSIERLAIDVIKNLIKNGVTLTYYIGTPDNYLYVFEHVCHNSSIMMRSLTNPDIAKEINDSCLIDLTNRSAREELKTKFMRDIREIIDMLISKNRKLVFSLNNEGRNAVQVAISSHGPYNNFIVEHLIKIKEDGEINWHNQDVHGDSVWTTMIKYHLNNISLWELLFNSGAHEALNDSFCATHLTKGMTALAYAKLKKKEEEVELSSTDGKCFSAEKFDEIIKLMESWEKPRTQTDDENCVSSASDHVFSSQLNA